MKRIFIAVKIEPADTLFEMFSAIKMALKDERIKWTDPGNFHLTLAFLGETEEDRIKVVSDMLKKVSSRYSEFDINLKGAGIFKSIHDPKVIWTGFVPSDLLDDLFASVKEGLNVAEIRIDARNFNPHLTLGRIKSIKEKEILKTLLNKYQDYEIQKQHISEIILYESLLFPSGPVYTPLGRFRLSI